MATSKLSPLERAEKLKREADQLFVKLKLTELTKEIGPLTSTGSYFMDTMIYPDMDFYLPPAKPRQLLAIATKITEKHPVERINFRESGPGPLKHGRYVKVAVAYGQRERSWKVDIWAINTDFIDGKMAELSRLKHLMDEELRELILDYKYSILTDEWRTPHFSGIFIYRAVLDQGLRNFSDITDYLKENSIRL